jgi:ABC-type transport system substrate-binding protein
MQTGKLPIMTSAWDSWDIPKIVEMEVVCIMCFSVREFELWVYENDQMSSILSQLNEMQDQKQRLALIQEATKVFSEDPGAVPLFSKVFNFFAKSDVYWKPSITLDFDFSEAHGWETKTTTVKENNFWSFLDL